MFNHICILICAICCLSSQLSARQGETDEWLALESEPQELPDGAIWRIGNSGESSDNNGYYLLAYSHDSKYLAARNRDNFVSVYNVATRKQLCQLEGGDGTICCIDFSPDSQFFLTSAKGDGETIKIWNTQTGKLKTEFGSNAATAFFSPNGNKVFALELESVQTYDVSTGELINSAKWKNNNNERRLSMSRDGRQVVGSTAMNNGLHRIFILDLESKSKTMLDGPAEEVKTVTLSANGLWIAASYLRDPKVRLWDLRDPHEQKFILAKQKRTVQSLSFSQDCRFLASTSFDNTAVVWDILTREPIAHLIGHQANVNSSAFSPLDLTLATGASGIADSSVLVWALHSQLFPNKELPRAFDSFEVIWKELGSNFPAQSFMAVQAIVSHGDDFIDRIAHRIGVDQDVNSENEILSWISDLDSPKYRIREEATQKLLAVRGIADPFLKEVLNNPPSTEVRYRVTLIMQQPITRPKTNFDELRRLHRSVFALELIGSQKALAVLNSIAGGHPNIDISRDAAEALSRFKSRQN